ncbi:MAG TPA: NADP-dependent oxidoreductase [Usitatibacter sp.]|jgi:NADPH:quinone reductase-like Zn-dependent oxidoreductase|nr:NADP-dependent oxidoreductase [Usitatibacter sp.]
MSLDPPVPAMRAWTIDAYGASPALTKVPVPRVGDADVLIRMHGAEVGDWDELVRRGEWPMDRPFPLVLGLAGSGRVSMHGPAVGHFRRHDPVFAYSYPLHDNGAWADYMLVPEAYVARAPASLTLANAGAVPIAGLTAHEAIHDVLEVKRGDMVLVTAAAGGVGHLAVQMARHLGARVVAVCGSDHVDFVRSLGAEVVVDHDKGDPVQAIRAQFPHGIAKVLNGVPGEAANIYVEAAAAGGRVLDLPGDITARKSGVEVNTAYVVQGDGERLAKVAGMVDDFLRVAISETYPFERAPQALATVLAKHVTGKIALHVVEPHGSREKRT